MQFDFEEILNLIKIPLFIAGFLAFGIWYVVDTYKISRFEGKIKRGVKVWSRDLTYDTWKYLSAVKQDIVERKKLCFLAINQVLFEAKIVRPLFILALKPLAQHGYVWDMLT
jgi:hypothetical protein